MKSSIWTPPDLVNWIQKDFKKRGFPEPHRLEAEYLVSHSLKISRIEIYLNHDKPCSSEEREAVKELLRRRQQHEPLAYILGTCDFWSLNLITRPGVLIPRLDTEILIEVALEHIPPSNRDLPFRLAELGTGSGAIPLAISLERRCLEIITVEKSSMAVAVARQNIDNYRSEIQKQGNLLHLVQGDSFTAIAKKKLFDMVISNPPYIPSKDLRILQKEVKDWEPVMALDGGIDGLEFYRYLFREASNIMKPEGVLIIEHGFEQKDALEELVQSLGTFCVHSSVKDLEKRDRVMVLKKN